MELKGIKKGTPHLPSNIEGIFRPGYKESLRKFLVNYYLLKDYVSHAKWYSEKIEKDFSKIDKKFLEKMTYDYKERIKRVDLSIETNEKLMKALVDTYQPSNACYEGFDMKEIKDEAYNQQNTLAFDVFYYIQRDWTDEGEKDRKRQYDVIIEEIKKLVKIEEGSTETKKILIPGAGVCRLAYDLSLIGYEVDCNDYSYLNFLFSDFLLTKAKKHEFALQPHYCEFSNFFKEDDVFHEYKIPNIDTGIDKPGQGKLFFSIGDFVLMYAECCDYYDAVTTVYFIDSALNIIKYIETIYRVLKKGGIWINYGPPTYDWGRDYYETVYAIPWDKQKEIMKNYGFEIIKEEILPNSYRYFHQKMMNTKNVCVIFTAVKK